MHTLGKPQKVLVRITNGSPKFMDLFFFIVCLTGKSLQSWICFSVWCTNWWGVYRSMNLFYCMVTTFCCRLCILDIAAYNCSLPAASALLDYYNSAQWVYTASSEIRMVSCLSCIAHKWV